MRVLLVAINSKYIHTNLAVRYIKSYCSSFDTNIAEYTINDSIDNIVYGIYSLKPDVVGFSCYIWNMEVVLKAASCIKKVLPRVKILFGGPEVSFDSKELMEKYNFIDFIIKGEGELASYQLFSYLEGNSNDILNVGNLVYRYNGTIAENNHDILISELDSIPFPYEANIESLKNKIVYYESSRGCPYNCSYCLSSTIKGVRFFSIERVKKDLKWFIDNDIPLVKFVDRTFNCGRNYKEIIRFLIDNKKNTRFHFEIESSSLDDESIELLCSAPEGLFQLEVGVQTTNKLSQQKINRNEDFEKVSENVKKLVKCGKMHIHLDLIAGLPYEGYSSFSRSFNNVFSLKPDMLQLGFLKLLKGSSIRDDARTLKIKYADYPPYEVLETYDLSFAELSKLKGIESIVDKYYNSGRFEAAVTYINMKYNDAFKMFEDIYEYISSDLKFQGNIGGTDQYRVLKDFCIKKWPDDNNIINGCLLFDYLKQGRNPYIPDFLKSGGEVQKGKVWEFLYDKDNIERFLPQYKGVSEKEIVKNIILVKFGFDLASFIESVKIICKETYICFDYRNKNSGNKVFILPEDLKI